MYEIQPLPPAIDGKYHYAALYLSPRSKKWPALKKLLNKVETYESDSNFIALFKSSLQDFEVLYNAMLISSGWKTVFYYYKGRPISSKQVWLPVACISGMKERAGKPESCICKSVNYDDMHNGSNYLRTFMIPCKTISHEWYRGKIGNNYKEQFLSSAQELGITTCPFFNPSHFLGPELEKWDGGGMVFSVKIHENSKHKSTFMQKVISFFTKKS